MKLIQLVYVSRGLIGNTPDLWVNPLERIISSAREFNKFNDVTGYMLFDGIEFAQILEGSEGAVLGTFLRIASDQKHENINLLNRGPIKQRRFENWSMGLAIRGDGLEKTFKYYGFLQPGQMSHQPLDHVLKLTMQISQSEKMRTARL